MPRTITLNGSSHAIPQEDYPLEDLLKELKLQDKPIVIELNAEALSPQTFTTTIIHPGDSLEIISIVAGG